MCLTPRKEDRCKGIFYVLSGWTAENVEVEGTKWQHHKETQLWNSGNGRDILYPFVSTSFCSSKLWFRMKNDSSPRLPRIWLHLWVPSIAIIRIKIYDPESLGSRRCITESHWIRAQSGFIAQSSFHLIRYDTTDIRYRKSLYGSYQRKASLSPVYMEELRVSRLKGFKHSPPLHATYLHVSGIVSGQCLERQNKQAMFWGNGLIFWHSLSWRPPFSVQGAVSWKARKFLGLVKP